VLVKDVDVPIMRKFASFCVMGTYHRV